MHDEHWIAAARANHLPLSFPYIDGEYGRVLSNQRQAFDKGGALNPQLTHSIGCGVNTFSKICITHIVNIDILGKLTTWVKVYKRGSENFTSSQFHHKKWRTHLNFD